MKQGLQLVLPERAAAYAKFYVALLGAVVTTVIGVTEVPDWLVTISSVLTAVGVFLQSNAVNPPAHSADTGSNDVGGSSLPGSL